MNVRNRLSRSTVNRFLFSLGIAGLLAISMPGLAYADTISPCPAKDGLHFDAAILWVGPPNADNDYITSINSAESEDPDNVTPEKLAKSTDHWLFSSDDDIHVVCYYLDKANPKKEIVDPNRDYAAKLEVPIKGFSQCQLDNAKKNFTCSKGPVGP